MQTGWYCNWGKRAIDLVIGIAVGAFLLPVMMVVGVAVACGIGIPVLFRQERAGRQGKVFTLVKFRSMTDQRDDKGELLPDEQRLTWIGRWIRRLSLDELPQLWNVIRGEMSLVGPRPLLVRYLKRYTPHQQRRHEVLPGITGLAQVNGRNALSWEQKFDLDVDYVDQLRFVLDIKILWWTVMRLFSTRGVSAAGHVTMPEFMGTEDSSLGHP